MLCAKYDGNLLSTFKVIVKHDAELLQGLLIKDADYLENQ